jgi:nucleoside-diphosphate-sugar epimerase
VKRIVERAHKLVRVGNKNSFVDTIYVDNAAEAHILAAKSLLEKPELSGKIYFISNSEPIPIWDIVNGILQAADLDPITKTVPHKLVWTVGAMLEFVYKVFMLKGEPVMTRFVADELATAHWFDITAAKTDLGYIPRVSIQEGLSRLKHWMRQGKGDV